MLVIASSQMKYIPNFMSAIKTCVVDLLDCDEEDIVFTQNAAASMLIVFRSLAKTLKKGDEILVTNFIYGESSVLTTK